MTHVWKLCRTFLAVNLCVALGSQAFAAQPVPGAASIPAPANASSTANATPSIAVGCPAPQNVPGHHTYYIDPNKGSMSGDGSAAHPWHTLAEVLDVRNQLVANAPATYIAGIGIVQPNPNAPIKSGDTLYLNSGAHGSVTLQGNFGTNNLLYGYNNSDFITIAAAPGQTPVITQLTLIGVNKFLFQGLTFQSLQNVPANHGQPFGQGGTQDYVLAVLFGPNSNVVFNNNHFLSQADTSTWTVTDWLYKRVSAITSIGGGCFSFTNNNIENIGFGIGSQRSTNVLISHNTIDHFTDDGIDYGSNNMIIDGNRITNSVADGDQFHPDGMQGQPYDDVTPVSNVRITNNVVIVQTMPLVAVNNLQGIDTFDGVWQNVTVSNNIVVTNAFHGITYYGTTNLVITNNTVLCTQSAGTNYVTWIAVAPSKTGSASANVTVRNNIATYYTITAVNAAIDHNMLASMNTSTLGSFQPSSNTIAADFMTHIFNTFSPTNFTYDLRLQSGIAVNGGTLALSPPTDIRGYLRGKQIGLGAVKYGGVPVTFLY